MSQYNRNTEILKSFFRKPLTLVISILFFTFTVISCTYSILSGIFYPTVFFFFSLLSILPAFAFLCLFIQGRRKCEINRLNAPLILICIYTVLSTFVPSAFFTYLMLTYFINENINSFLQLSAVAALSILMLPAMTLLILNFISAIITFCSIRKSANGIYLSKKGSVFMGVTSIAFSANMILIMVYFLKTIDFSTLLKENYMFDCVILMLEGGVVTTLFICLGIWALMYSSAINNAAVCLHGANKKSVIKAQTLADTLMTAQTEAAVDNIYFESDFVNQKTYGNGDFAFSAVTENQKPEVFALPKQDGPNPYGNKKSIQKQDKTEETLNHINYQNPYENFTPQNPFE